jgi:hypothetical protein
LAILVGLRPFAHIKRDTEAAACVETTLAQGFTTERSIINSQTQLLQAVGSYTPLAYTLGVAEGDFQEGNDNILVLLSDGKDTCGGDPVSAAGKLFNSSKKIKVYVIGLGVDADTRSQLSAIASSGGGAYYDATDVNTLTANLKKITEVEFDKTIELEEEIDFIKGYGVMGGGSFANAEFIGMNKYEGDDKFHHLTDSLRPGQKTYFVSDICPTYEEGSVGVEVSVDLTLYGDRMGVDYDGEKFIESDLHSYRIDLYDSEHFLVGTLVSAKDKSMHRETGSIIVEEPEICTGYYFVVGSDDRATSKYDVFEIKVRPSFMGASNKESNTNSGGILGTSNTVNSGSNDQGNNPINNLLNSGGAESNFVLLLVGGVVLILLLIVVIIVLLNKGKNRNINEAVITENNPPNNNYRM